MELRRLQEESLLETGESTLPCYPWPVKPRAQHLTRKRIKKKQRLRRIRSWHERQQQRRSAQSDDVADEDDNSGVGDSNNDSDDEEQHVDIEVDVWDVAGTLNESHLADSAPNVAPRALLPGEQAALDGDAPLMGRQLHCGRCGSGSHTAPTCNSSNISYLLRKRGVLPGQFEQTAAGKRVRANYEKFASGSTSAGHDGEEDMLFGHSICPIAGAFSLRMCSCIHVCSLSLSLSLSRLLSLCLSVSVSHCSNSSYVTQHVQAFCWTTAS